MTDVVICVPTYRRPASLRALLAALAERIAEVTADVGVLVIDNDESRSAEPVVAVSGLRPRYVVEERRGLSAVRNRALAETADAGFVVFIDDDELPHDGWLKELLAVQERYTADVVAGPALLSLPTRATVLADSGIFDRPRHRTGLYDGNVHTNNVLFRRAAVAAAGASFDPFFSLSAGEDTDFFLRLRAAGARIAWADDAVVSEPVVGDRLRPRYVLRRSYAMACTYTHIERRHHSRGWRVSRQILRICLQLLRAARWGARFLRRRRTGFALRCAWHLAYATGTLAGLAGRRADSY